MHLRVPAALTASAGLALSAGAATPGEGIRFEKLTLRPSVDAGLTWDSNVWMANENARALREAREGPDAAPDPSGRDEVVSDIFYRLGAGLSAATRSDRTRASADAWGSMTRYQDTGARDSEEFGERFQLAFGDRRTIAVSIYQRFAMADQYDRGPAGRDLDPAAAGVADVLTDPTLRERASLNQRTMLDVGADAGRDLSDKMTGDLRYLFAMQNYDEEEADFTLPPAPPVAGPDEDEDPSEALNLNNTSTHGLSGVLGWKATHKSSVTLTGEGQLQESDGFENPAVLLAVRAGVVSRTTTKVQYRAGLGLMHYAVDSYGTNSGPFRVNPESGRRERIEPETETHVEPSVELGASWTPTARWQFLLSAATGFQPSIQYNANAIYNSMASASLACRITRSLTATVSAGFRRDEYLDPVLIPNPDPDAVEAQIPLDKTADVYSVGAGLDFRPEGSWWAARAEARTSESTSNDEWMDYSAAQVSAGISMWY